MDKAVKRSASNADLGAMKKGDLAGVRVYTFKVSNQQYLLGYRVEQEGLVLTLLALGPHENFYRDLKR